MNQAAGGQWRHRGVAALVFFGLLGLALGLFALVAWLESTPGQSQGAFGWLARLEGHGAMDRIASSAEVVAGVLAIAITVVAIVVELAANRYTHRITQLFVREPVNFIVMGFFVLTTVLCVWFSVAPSAQDVSTARVPYAGLLLTMSMVTICLLLLLPYFAFVFRFLEPGNVITRIGDQASRAILRATREMKPGLRSAAVEAIEELEDVAHGAREHSDRTIAMAAVDALQKLLTDYAPLRSQLPARWFEIDGALLRDPDFVSMDRTVVAEMVDERIWFETKVLRQYNAIYTESLIVARDIANLVALNTRRIGVAASQGDLAVLRLSVRFFNSYLRAAINAHDLRTAYYVLQQYRMLCESVLDARQGEVALEIAEHFRYYGLEALSQGDGFLLEVVAYDLSQLIEFAVEAGYAEAEGLLNLFLKVDREIDSRSEEPRLRGVRRSQVQLATFYLDRGDELNARRIFADMEHERPERLIAVRDELLREERPHYWEFTDRGVNFSYLPPNRRAQVETFYAWFGSHLKGG